MSDPETIGRVVAFLRGLAAKKSEDAGRLLDANPMGAYVAIGVATALDRAADDIEAGAYVPGGLGA